jgi:hypothetical protein
MAGRDATIAAALDQLIEAASALAERPPSAHQTLRCLVRHHISPAQKASGTRRRDVTQGHVLDRC